MKQEILVKGVSRRVVIVPTDAQSVFEEVICIVKEDAETVTADGILREAEAALLRSVEEEADPVPLFLRLLPALMAVLLLVLAGVLTWCFFFGV